MGTWGRGFFGKSSPGYWLEKAVANLNPAAKKAFFSAATHGNIAQGTWDGCAFNAGGLEIGNPNVNSSEKAAEAFDLPVTVVIQFIAAWDGFNVPNPTESLREILVKVGIFTDPNPNYIPKNRVRQIVEAESRQLAELEIEVQNFQIPNHNEAAELLFAGV